MQVSYRSNWSDFHEIVHYLRYREKGSAYGVTLHSFTLSKHISYFIAPPLPASPNEQTTKRFNKIFTVFEMHVDSRQQMSEDGFKPLFAICQQYNDGDTRNGIHVYPWEQNPRLPRYERTLQPQGYPAAPASVKLPSDCISDADADAGGVGEVSEKLPTKLVSGKNLVL